MIQIASWKSHQFWNVLFTFDAVWKVENSLQRKYPKSNINLKHIASNGFYMYKKKRQKQFSTFLVKFY